LRDWAQIGLFVTLILIFTPLVGGVMVRIFEGRPPFFLRPFRWLETLSQRVSGIDASEEMDWRQYTAALLIFNAVGFLLLLMMQLFQGFLPMNPQHLPGVPFWLAFNTATSFTTNTNWQAYAGETTLSYFVQMAGLTVHNFVSAATGMCALLAMVRGFTRSSTRLLGNFWVDLIRGIVYLLLPVSFVAALFLISQGVIQTFAPYVQAVTLEGVKQVIPLGPVASQIAIKQLGSNGGGFFNANSAHPFENPTPLTNLIEMLFIILIPAAITYWYGRTVKSRKHGWLLFGVMFLIWFSGFLVSLGSEGHLMEGKEQRFGVVLSLLWSTMTTVVSNGSVNAMHSSLTPLAGGVALFNILLGEIVYGGIGVGMAGMLLFVLLTVFLAGLMVGRTPEYLGKKVEAREMKWVILAILTLGAAILAGTSLALRVPSALASLSHKGPHGFSEMFYAYASTVGNNGSAFAGLNANTDFFNITLGIAMWIGRLAVVIPCIAIGGLMAQKSKVPASSGTFRTDNLLFAILLLGVILIVGGLTFFPGLLLGPGVEHLIGLQGRAF
jgi:K+-transporting ATPase ATPase A chain